MALVEEKPQYGGILNAALAADPPSLDMHQEQTFAVAQPLGPIYNNLLQFDPHNYPTSSATWPKRGRFPTST